MEFGTGVRVSSVAGTGLAELVEAGRAGTPETRAVVTAVLSPEIEAGSDTVVLGCTHYHFLAGDIAAAFPSVEIIDTSAAVARRTVQVLAETGLEAPESARGALSFIVSGDRPRFHEAMAHIGFPAQSEEAPV
jgi:glutamate racemase